MGRICLARYSRGLQAGAVKPQIRDAENVNEKVYYNIVELYRKPKETKGLCNVIPGFRHKESSRSSPLFQKVYFEDNKHDKLYGHWDKFNFIFLIIYAKSKY